MKDRKILLYLKVKCGIDVPPNGIVSVFDKGFQGHMKISYLQ